MQSQLLVALALVFVAVALLAGTATWMILARTSPERRRMRNLAVAGAPVWHSRATGAPGGLITRYTKGVYSSVTYTRCGPF